MSIKIAIFDFDDTLVHEGFEPPIECEDALKVIQFFKKKKYIICIATFNEYGIELCEQTSFCKYVDMIIALNTDDNKDYHFRTILDHYQCNPEDCIVFDDIKENIKHAKELGMKAKLVKWKQGVTINDAKDMI